MKKLSRFILASYLRPLLRSLVVSLFLLVLQFLSRYRKDLFGKGLDADVILSIFGYASISLIVLALPVSVLVASLFTMGTFGEQYELAAMRSSGLSTRRIITPMIAMTLMISLISFGLSSYVVPVANLKLYSLLYDVSQLKPTFSLEPGHFNSDIDNYVIRIGDKDLSKEMLYDIMIYDHTDGRGNDVVVLADSGYMRVDPYGTYMNMWLFDGASYETVYKDKGRITETESFVRFQYRALYYNFDLSGFSLERTAEDDFRSHHYMQNLEDLRFSMDTVDLHRDSVVFEYQDYMLQKSPVDSNFLDMPDSTLSIPPDNILLVFPKYKRREIMRRAISGASSMQKAAEVTSSRLDDKDLRYRNYLIEYHGKFSLPVACIIFLFIGAPLGAVVRKGGVGLPILVSVFFYLSFYVIMIQGKKIASEAVVPVWFGVWLPVLVMAPLAILFTYQAASMRSLNFGVFFYTLRSAFQDFLVFILRPIVRLFRKRRTEPAEPVRRQTILPDDLSLPDMTVGADSEWERWQRELGLSDEGGEGSGPSVAPAESSGDADELARWERELGLTSSDGGSFPNLSDAIAAELSLEEEGEPQIYYIYHGVILTLEEVKDLNLDPDKLRKTDTPPEERAPAARTRRTPRQPRKTYSYEGMTLTEVEVRELGLDPSKLTLVGGGDAVEPAVEPAVEETPEVAPVAKSSGPKTYSYEGIVLTEREVKELGLDPSKLTLVGGGDAVEPAVEETTAEQPNGEETYTYQGMTLTAKELQELGISPEQLQESNGHTPAEKPVEHQPPSREEVPPRLSRRRKTYTYGGMTLTADELEELGIDPSQVSLAEEEQAEELARWERELGLASGEEPGDGEDN